VPIGARPAVEVGPRAAEEQQPARAAVRRREPDHQPTLDTEGAEVEVLAGAAATLRRTERVVLEWHTLALRVEAGALLAAAGFDAVLAHGSIDYYRRTARANA